MSDFRISFLTYYLQSLGERTREEKRGTKFGFDWVIYNLALADDWIPHRLPFLRSGGSQTSITKTEPEFGVDLAFLSQDSRTLRVFVLKDEVLKNSTWGTHNFDIDIRNAAAPDLTTSHMVGVEQVEVVLAYNKDEDAAGVELYNRLISALGTRVGDKVTLRFDRWNLTTIVGKVSSQLLTPSLLPQKFFSHFSYICAQFADFRHGSDEWVNQIVPNWRRFLEELLSENADERCVRLLPVALIILQEYASSNPARETAWIDLIEWGMLAAWNVSQVSDKQQIKSAVFQIWNEFYIAEIQRYYDLHHKDLAIPLSIDKPLSGGYVDAIASAVVAHWHVARIGILSIAYRELFPKETDEERVVCLSALDTVARWLIGFVNANPSTMRPIIDLHHIELVLAWATLCQTGRKEVVANWMLMLVNRMYMRRSGVSGIPFIEGHNSLELIFEYAATGDKPIEFCDTSSVYLMCMMELICYLPESYRDDLLVSVYNRIVLGIADCGAKMDACNAIDLMLWIPPEDWGTRVLKEQLSRSGECATIHLVDSRIEEPPTGKEIAAAIIRLVAETRLNREFKWPQSLPLSVVFLGCLKHRSPIPPEVWRHSIFPDGNVVDSNGPSSMGD